MNILQILVLRGPNVWANFPVIEVLVDLRPSLDVPSNTFPGFNDRLKSWLPSMIEHRCGIGERGGFFQRLDTGTYLGHILEHTSLEIQSLVGPVVGFGRARESYIAGVYRVAVEYAEERLGLACVKTAIELLNAARTGDPFDVSAELSKLRKLAENYCLGPSTQAIVSAAKARGIPWTRLSDNSLVQLGQGSAQKRIWTAETDQTSAIAESIAQDKDLTRTLLRQSGVPVPEGRPVKSAEEAARAAEDLGFPVVVKPREGHHGRGVSIDLVDRDSVMRAYSVADAEGVGVIVEQCIPGIHHRLLVVGNRLVAAAQGEPDHVVGDGKHSIRELVDLGNQHPDRGDPEIHMHDRLVLDSIALELLGRQGLSPDTVPPLGKRVILHHNGDLPNDVTAQVHPEVARLAVLSARTVGLNIAGVDMMLSDISRAPDEQRGAVLEVNASPSLLMHVKPLRGQPQPVGEAIVAELFAPGKNGRIPVVTVSGTNGKSTVIAMLERVLLAQSQALRLGIASSDSLSIAGRALVSDKATDYDSVARIFVNPIVDAALVEMDPRTIYEQGIAFDQCQVAVVTNIASSDHLGLKLMDRDRMILIERCGIDMVLPDGFGVLNADDAEVLSLAPKCPGKILLFSRQNGHKELVAHRAKGGRTVSVDGKTVRFDEGPTSVGTAVVPSWLASFDVENLLACLGAAWAMGVAPSHLAASVAALYGSDASADKGDHRWRRCDSNGRSFFVTMARNPSSVEASMALAFAKGSFARRIAIQTQIPSDWRREDAFTVGSLLGNAFNEVRLAVESLPDRENIGVPSSENGQPELELLRAFEEGVRSQNHAEFVALAPLSTPSWTDGHARSNPGDLLFVQVGNSSGLASFSLPEEGLPNSESNSAATGRQCDDRSQVEV